jgi:serine/threonine-protein kinase
MTRSVSADPRVGTELAGYRIEALLSRGGMADVYRAVDSRLGRRVALKLLAPDLAGDERFRERFLRESRLAASLDHPNVIPIYEAGEAEGLLYIAMRFVEGSDLRTLLAQEGPLEPVRTFSLLAPVAEALDAAHARGLVHRDVKPGNVLITSEGGREHVYLSDFGLTKQASSESGVTETGQFVGTADYVAPEQIDGRPVDARSDQYSLGCVLHECLTGEPPFHSDRLMAVLWAHMTNEPAAASARNSELPAAIDPVIARALAKDPSERYGSCRELLEAARLALGISAELPQPVAPPPPAPRSACRPGRPARRGGGDTGRSPHRRGAGVERDHADHGQRGPADRPGNERAPSDGRAAGQPECHRRRGGLGLGCVPRRQQPASDRSRHEGRRALRLRGARPARSAVRP